MQNFTWEQEPQLADKQLVWADFKLTEEQVELPTDQNEYDDKMIDLRPYMVEMPFSVVTSDKLNKVVNLFRHM